MSGISDQLNAPDVAQSMLGQGLEVWTKTPDAFGAHIRSEAGKWARSIRQAGINET